MWPNVYQNFCDPLLEIDDETRFALLNLHCMLFRRPLIQDNFLISRAFQRATQKRRDLLPGLFSSNVLGVALRNEAVSLCDLREKLKQKVKDGRYKHFTSETESTRFVFGDARFTSYLKNIDSAISADQVIPWDPNVLGAAFRQRMLDTAESGISGIDKKIAIAVWNSVEARAVEKGEEGRHSRTRYDDVCADFTDINVRRAILTWMSRTYLSIMPDTLNLASSIPNLPTKLCPSHSSVNPNTPTIAGRPIVPRRSILHRRFLAELDSDSIMTFRTYPEFQAWTQALDSGDTIQASTSLDQYLDHVAFEAPRHYGRHKRRIKRAEYLYALAIRVEQVGNRIVAYLEDSELGGRPTKLISILCKAVPEPIHQRVTKAVERANTALASDTSLHEPWPEFDIVHSTNLPYAPQPPGLS